jgi:O-antigen ligase/polysaccharide polymerase Wzy-like membrane protein
MGERRRAALPAALDRAALDRGLGGVVLAALLVGLAGDDGGFAALAWDRALLGLTVVVLLWGLLVDARRPGRDGAVLLGALCALTAWTALSWLWSASPARALEEAQRVALYAAIAAAVLVCWRRTPSWIVPVSSCVVAVWNLVAAGGTGTGAGSQPVGYANGLALLCVVGIVAALALPLPAWVVAVPPAAVLVEQHSSGAWTALAVGVVVFLVRDARLRLAVVVLAVAGLLASPFVASGHEREHYWRVAATEYTAHPVLGSGAGTFIDWWVRERTVPLQTEEAHSLYVETLAELGPLGVALVLVAFAVPIARARRPELAAGVAAFAVGAAVDFDWELAGVTAPAVVLAALAVADRDSGRLPLRALVPVAAVVAAAALLAYAGSSRLAAAQDAAQAGRFPAAQRDARAAHRWLPYSPDPWAVLGDVTRDPAYYRRAVALDPSDWSLWQRLAAVSSGKLRRLAEGKAAQLNPLGGGASGS